MCLFDFGLSRHFRWVCRHPENFLSGHQLEATHEERIKLVQPILHISYGVLSKSSNHIWHFGDFVVFLQQKSHPEGWLLQGREFQPNRIRES